jgi:uncharacterized protein (TIGR02246 family)
MVCITAAVLAVWVATAVAQQRATTPAAEPAREIPEIEKPFWQNAQAFVDAYVKKDAAAIGNLFTEDAEFYDEFGELTVGREAIVRMYQDVFDTAPDVVVDEIAIERVRFIGDSVALEEGEVGVSQFEGGPREINRYIAIYLKGKDGTWRINTLKDFPRENPTPQERLDQLSWLLGEWVSEDPTSVVHTECHWSEDGNYLLRQYTVQIGDQPVMKGEQRIGWDPIRKVIRSWAFDSEGGYLAGTWRRSGDRWLVSSDGYNSDGEPTSALAVYTIHDPERITWQYRNVVIGNELQEDIKPIVMARRPPEPQGTN